MTYFPTFSDFDIVNLETKETNVNLADKPDQTQLFIIRVYNMETLKLLVYD